MSEELYASALLHWPESIPDLESKRALAARAAARASHGQLIGIGSGASAYLLLWAIAGQDLDVAVACCSYETETAALTLGLELRQLGSVEPDWGLDSADAVDPDKRLLVSHGATLAKQKLLWSTAQRMYLAVDPGASVTTLGPGMALPVEVHPDAVIEVARELDRLGADDVALRLSTGKDGPVFTEAGNLLLDARFPQLAAGLDAALQALPGVIETGLFEGREFEIL